MSKQGRSKKIPATNLPPYDYIRAWGTYLHSFNNYIQIQIDLARKENAPFDAIYRNEDGTWSTFQDITNNDVAVSIRRLVEDIEAKEGR